MALTATEKSLCNKVSTDYDSIVAPAKSAKTSIRGKTADLDTLLRGMVWSPDSKIDDAIDQLETGVAGMVPGDDAEALNDLASFIDNCSYLSGLAPVSAVVGSMNGLFEGIDDLVDSLKITVPEFGAGALANLINQLLAGAGLPGGDILSALLAKADNLINCLDLSCRAKDPSYNARLTIITTDLDDLYTDLNINGDPLNPNYGKFDYDKLYSNIGMSVVQQDKINKVITSVDKAKTDAKKAIDNSVSSIKVATKIIGGIF